MNIWADANGWPFPPVVLFGCLIAEILYFRGWRLLIKHELVKEAARARMSSASTSVYQWNSWFWRGIYFQCAIFVFLLASSAPVDILSGRLFWVHMVQHLLLLVVMAPLLVAGAPLLPLWLGLPRQLRRLVKVFTRLTARRVLLRVGHWLQQPVIACALLIIGTWIWHWPPLYDLALTNGAIHDWCEHATFLAVSIIFWAQVIPSYPLRPRLGYLGRMGYLGVAIAQNFALAVLLGFAPQSLYAPYAHLVQGPGGFTALQDQQIGAGIMWTFGDLPFGVAISILIQRWLASQPDETTIAVKSHEG
ncbi:MAG: cytochrome c oxidase assembly protein [Chloroflexota bacterium]|nr:cytochrome c oxidase assembly protein [Chloroflexota bacterium]